MTITSVLAQWLAARQKSSMLTVNRGDSRLNIEFVSFRERIDTAGPLGRPIMVIVCAVAELERSLFVERVRAGMRRAKLEGRHIDCKRWSWIEPRSSAAGKKGQTLGLLAKTHLVSRTTTH